MEAKIYAIASQKGGVGKTTTAHNLSVAVARKGRKVLAVDLDAQANLTDACGLDPREVSLTTFERMAGASGPVIPGANGDPDLMPSNLAGAKAELQFFSEMNRERLLKKALKPFRGEYDYIFIDCPPNLGLVTLNAFLCASRVLIPVPGEYFALTALEGLSETISAVNEKLDHEIGIAGIVLTLFDKRKTLSRDVVREIRKGFDDLLYETAIRANVALAEAPSHYKNIFDYQPESNGAFDYSALCAEFIRREEV